MKKEETERTEEMATNEEVSAGSEMETVQPEIDPADEDAIFEQVEGLKNGVPLEDGTVDNVDNSSESEAEEDTKEHDQDSDEELTKEESKVDDNEEDEIKSRDEELSEIERLRAELAKAKRDAMSARGNASKAMSELARINRELKGAIVNKDSGLALDKDKLKELKEDYGLDLSIVEEAIHNQQTQAERLAALEQELIVTRDTLAAQQAKLAVAPKYGDVDQITSSKEFAGWFDTLGDSDKAFVISTNDPDEISTILDTFIAETGYRTPIAREENSKEVSRLKAKAEKKKVASLGVKGKGVAQKIGNTNTDYVDEDKIFREVESRIL